MKKLIIASATLLLCLGLIGCDRLPTSGEADCSSDGTLFEDPFDADINCGWAQFSGSESAVIEEGSLRLSVGSPGTIAWSVPGRDFGDVEVGATVRQISGPSDNAFGLICRYRDESNYYLFLISSDGFYAIGKYLSGNNQIQYLTGESPDHYIRSDSINLGSAPNQLRVRCIGNRLTLFVNGFQLAEVVDGSIPAGDIGVAAGTFEPGVLVVEFDDVEVTAP